MAPRLIDKVAVVTGGGSGIGRATALQFARDGAHVAVLDVDKPGADDVAGTIRAAGQKAAVFQCDVSDLEQVMATFDAIREEVGPVDILFNNAGISHIGTVGSTTAEDFDRVYRVNVRGVFHCLKAAVMAMQGRGGAIVNMASVVSAVGIPDRFAYSMSKGAVLTMTLSVACDYLQEGIRCNAIAPARIHTPFVDGFLARNYPGREAEMFARLEKTQPIGRMGTPEEVAHLAAYLCSDEAGFITGSVYPIDGGFISLRP